MDVLKQQFFCCTPVNQINFNSINDKTSWNDQPNILKETVLHNLNTKYPLKHLYQVAFMRKLIKHLENMEIEIHDFIYSYNCKLMEINQEELEHYSYKHYISTDESIVISLKESTNLISDGTTGLRTWEAALVLSNWCLQNPEAFKDKVVLELGSGVGLTGLVVAKYCNTKITYLTDCHPSVLELLVENVKLNCKNDFIYKNVKFPYHRHPLSEKVIYSTITDNKAADIHVVNLPWEELKEDSSIVFDNKPDVIIASDVVYDSSIFTDLINAFDYFCDGDSHRKIILACTIRNQETLDEFLMCLDKKEFVHTELYFEESKLLLGPVESSVKIYYIFKKDTSCS